MIECHSTELQRTTTTITTRNGSLIFGVCLLYHSQLRSPRSFLTDFSSSLRCRIINHRSKFWIVQFRWWKMLGGRNRARCVTVMSTLWDKILILLIRVDWVESVGSRIDGSCHWNFDRQLSAKYYAWNWSMPLTECERMEKNEQRRSKHFEAELRNSKAKLSEWQQMVKSIRNEAREYSKIGSVRICSVLFLSKPRTPYECTVTCNAKMTSHNKRWNVHASRTRKKKKRSANIENE